MRCVWFRRYTMSISSNQGGRVTGRDTGWDMKELVRRIKQRYGSVQTFAQTKGCGSRWLGPGYDELW